MTPGRVSLKVVEDRLRIVADCVAGLRSLPAGTLEAFRSDPRNPATAESLLRRAIEALFDTARHVLSKAFGLGALEYREVALQSAARGLLASAETAGRFREMAGYRNRLVHHYEAVTVQELHRILHERLGDLEAVAAALQTAAASLAKP